MREAVILAGGLGTRLRAAVAGRPKAMALVAGRPFLEWQLDYLRTQRVQRVVLAVGHLADQLVAHFGSGYRDIAIDYEVESMPRGTGGALRSALDRVTSAAAFALNGDTLLLADLDALEGRGDERIVMAVRAEADCARYGAVQVDNGRVVAFHEKGSAGGGYINGGVYWMRRDLFASYDLPEAFSFERDFLGSRAQALAPRAVVTDAFFLDIGTPSTYVESQLAIPDALRHISAA
ncbi:MAG: sugar phosphate nucleotidyltransferase [Burkholderiales bacterium]